MVILVVCRWWMGALLCAGVGVACGGGSSASSSATSALRVVAAKSHLVAVAYRAFGAAEQDCQDKFNSGVLTNDAEGVACIDDGLRASKLEGSIETLRRQVVSVGQNGSQDCKAAARRLAGIVQEEETTIRALHDDLGNLDGQAFNRDYQHAIGAAGRENELIPALLHAC